jgi:micrococcal nuclease
MFLLCSPRRALIAPLLLAAACALTTDFGQAREVLPGPFRAEVEQVIDGDTIAVRIAVWLGQELRVRVRIRGIDAPELRCRCPEECRLAQEAAEHVSDMIAGGPVVITNVSGGKYFGRVIADVAAGGEDVAATLLALGLAHRYQGRGPRPDWCGDNG